MTNEDITYDDLEKMAFEMATPDELPRCYHCNKVIRGPHDYASHANNIYICKKCWKSR